MKLFERYYKKNYSEIKNSFKELFPKTFKSMEDTSRYDSYLGFNKITRDKKMENMLKNILDIDREILIYSCGDPIISNAWTVPFVDFYDFNGKTMYDYNAFINKKYQKTDLKKIANNTKNLKRKIIKRKDGKVRVEGFIPNFKSVNGIYTFTLADKLKEKELIAIMLHEIGHNTNFDLLRILIKNNHSFNNTLKKINTFITILLTAALLLPIPKKIRYLIAAISMFIKLLAIQSDKKLKLYTENKAKILLNEEFDADFFAVKCGYGEHLKTALINMQNTVRKNRGLIVSEIDRKMNNISKSMEIEMEKNPYASTHPSLKRRIKAITESIKKESLDEDMQEGLKEMASLLNVKTMKHILETTKPLFSTIKKLDDSISNLIRL